jgi:hypothetical protein
MIHLTLNELNDFVVHGLPCISVAPAASVRYCSLEWALKRLWLSIDASENGVSLAMGTGEQPEVEQLMARSPTSSAVALPPGPLAVWDCDPSASLIVVPDGPSESDAETVSPTWMVSPLPMEDPLI